MLIVGAGLAGLTAFRLLRAEGHEVQLVEQARRFDRRGYGIGLWSNAWRVLEDAGAADAVFRAGVTVDYWEVRDAAGRVLQGLRPQREGTGRFTVQEDTRRPFTVIHRADLHEALGTRVPNDVVTMGTTVRDVAQDDNGVTVTLSDGARERADVLVGADGVHSRVRELVFGSTPRDLGTAAWAFWVPDGIELPDGFTEMWGENGKALLVVGVSGTRMATLSMPVPAQAAIEDPLAYLKARSREWILPDVIDRVTETGGDVFFDRNRRVDLARFDRGRVVLLGDAAHALHPIVGMGASLAMEDAWVLSDQLGAAGGRGSSERAAHHEDPERLVYGALGGFTSRRRGPARRAQREAEITSRLVLTESLLVRTARNVLAARTPLFHWFFARQAAQLSRPLAERL